MFHFSKKSLIISRMREDPKLSEKKQSVNPKIKAAEVLEYLTDIVLLPLKSFNKQLWRNKFD